MGDEVTCARGYQGVTRESEIEAVMRKQLLSRGCLIWKFVSPGCAGVPDRIVVLPKGQIYFVELKADGGRASEIQIYRAEQLQAHGCNYRLVRGRAGVDAFRQEVDDERRAEKLPAHDDGAHCR